jgi:hypothetical protein
MDNIQNDAPIDKNYNVDKKAKPENLKDKKVDKGFSDKNSFSSKEKKDNTLLNNKINQPKLDAPTLSPVQIEQGMKEAVSILASSEEGDKQTKNDVLKTNKKVIEKSITKKKIKNQLEMTEQLLEKTKPKNKELKSDTQDYDKINEKIKDNIQQDNTKEITNKKTEEIIKLSNTFFEVIDKFSRIKSAPKQLRSDITNKVNSFISDLAKGEQDLDTDTALLKLMEVKSMLSDSRIVLEQKTIKAQQLEKERIANKEMEKILESIEKSKEAKKSGGIGKILGYIGAGLMIVVAAVMVAGAVFTGGTSAIAGAALIVTATSLMITMQVSQETGGWMTKMFGEDNQLAATIFLTGLIVVLSLGAAAASGVSAAGSVATAAGRVATATEKFVAITDKITKGVSLAAGATQMSSATANGIAAHQRYEATNLSADAKEERAKWMKVQLFIDENMKLLIKMISNMNAPIQDIIDAYKTTADSKSKVLRNFN